jgi:hypothetical protein
VPINRLNCIIVSPLSHCAKPHILPHHPKLLLNFIGSQNPTFSVTQTTTAPTRNSRFISFHTTRPSATSYISVLSFCNHLDIPTGPFGAAHYSPQYHTPSCDSTSSPYLSLHHCTSTWGHSTSWLIHKPPGHGTLKQNQSLQHLPAHLCPALWNAAAKK